MLLAFYRLTELTIVTFKAKLKLKHTLYSIQRIAANAWSRSVPSENKKYQTRRARPRTGRRGLPARPRAGAAWCSARGCCWCRPSASRTAPRASSSCSNGPARSGTVAPSTCSLLNVSTLTYRLNRTTALVFMFRKFVCIDFWLSNVIVTNKHI